MNSLYVNASLNDEQIDFRTVNLDDALNGVGAPNLDSECSGTAMREYLHE